MKRWRIQNPKRLRVLAGALLLSAATIAVAETVTLKGRINVLDDKSGNADEVARLNPGGKLEVLGREGGWAHVRTADGKEGYISNQALADNTAGGFDLSGMTGGDSQMDTGAAGKGLDKEAVQYASSKNLSPAGAQRIEDIRKSVTNAEWKKFAEAGKVGPYRQK